MKKKKKKRKYSDRSSLIVLRQSPWIYLYLPPHSLAPFLLQGKNHPIEISHRSLHLTVGSNPSRSPDSLVLP